MKSSDWIGWLSSLVLLLTIGRQVYTQWRDGATAGVSHWLFIGQLTASCGFVIYSFLVRNWVFVISNIAMFLTAVVGQWIFYRNQQRDQGSGPPSHRGSGKSAAQRGRAQRG